MIPGASTFTTLGGSGFFSGWGGISCVVKRLTYIRVGLPWPCFFRSIRPTVNHLRGRRRQPIHSIPYSVALPLERDSNNYYSIIQGGGNRGQHKFFKLFLRRRGDAVYLALALLLPLYQTDAFAGVQLGQQPHGLVPSAIQPDPSIYPPAPSRRQTGIDRYEVREEIKESIEYAKASIVTM